MHNAFPSSARLSAILLLAVAAACGLAGCGTVREPVTNAPSTTPVSTDNNITGNWQGSLSATGGTKALGNISGSIDQSGSNTTAGQFTTAVFRIDSGCFVLTPSIPSQGFVTSSSVSLNSFAVEHQYLVLTGTSSSAGASISGTYQVHGGCAEGSAGNFAMQRYAPFTGTYSGMSAGGQTLTLTSSQSDGADGAGAFAVSATATFANFTCFTQGSTLPSGIQTISGANVQLLLTTDDRSGGQLQLTGSLTPDAKSLSPLSYLVVGGNCAGQSGTAVLQRK